MESSEIYKQMKERRKKFEEKSRNVLFNNTLESVEEKGIYEGCWVGATFESCTIGF